MHNWVLFDWGDTLMRIFCYRTVGHRKASPPFFAHVMRELDLPARQLVMAGDDVEQDVTAPNAVGIKAVWFNPGDHESRTGPDFRTIHALTELPQQLEEWQFLA